jgi:hypothetical protein
MDMNDVADKTGVTIVDHNGVPVFRGIILGQLVRGCDAGEFLQHFGDGRRIRFSFALLKNTDLNVVRGIRHLVKRANLAMYLGAGGRSGIRSQYKLPRDAMDFPFRKLFVPRSLAAQASYGNDAGNYSDFQSDGKARKYLR